MAARDARTEADVSAASADSEEKDVKIPVEDADEARVDEVADAAAETPVEGEGGESAAAEMTEDEMIEAAIRAGEEAAENDFKVKYEQAQEELAAVRKQLAEAEETAEGADAKVREANERAQRLQADWENYRRRTAAERLAEQSRAT